MDQIVYKRKLQIAPIEALSKYSDQPMANAGLRAKFSNPGNGLLASQTQIGTHASNSEAFRLTAKESEEFLLIVKATTKISCHYDLFNLLQNEVQYFIPHEILIAAWGDFQGAKPHLDVISAIQGVRTSKLNGCGVEQTLKSLHRLWITGGRQPMLLDAKTPSAAESTSCNCALHIAMGQMQSVLVHGVRNERDNLDSLYVALNPLPIRNGEKKNHDREFFLVDSIIAQVDVAFRKVAALKPVCSTIDQHASRIPDNLSPREQEILKWIAEGKTNAEIAEILGISSFTVKNHAQRIFRKLDVSNRTEAVSKRP